MSVLMLREGWDVRNVSVILGLRPFTAKANILPEQAIGRGLRLMRKIGAGDVQILGVDRDHARSKNSSVNSRRKALVSQ